MEEDEVCGEGVGCMNVLDRLKNAYAGGGLREIARKSFFHCIYRINNYKTKFIVNHKKIEYGLNTTEAREKKVIVSLTSFPPRFANIHLTLKSLLLQYEKPDRIIVYLGSDSSREQFTNEMQELEQYPNRMLHFVLILQSQFYFQCNKQPYHLRISSFHEVLLY